MPTLRLDGISREFGGGVKAVDDVGLTFDDGKLTALLGPSGCGKTSLLKLIAGLDTPTRGKLLKSGMDITAQPAHVRRFGMVFQSFALFPHLNVIDNVAYSLSIRGVRKADRERTAKQLLNLVQLDNLGSRRITELSGGQRQRVAIARALAQSPEIFLLDEPMSALDAQLREAMQIELRVLQQKLAITTIVVTHDQREAMTMADKIVVMNKGRVEQVGTPQEIYNLPGSRFVASFIGKTNFMDGIVEQGCVRLLDTHDLLGLSDSVSFVSGARVTIGCRPESTVLLDGAAEGPNRLKGKVTFVRDIGSLCEVFVEVGNNQLVCELSGLHRPNISPGDTVTIHLPKDALRVYPYETSEAA